MAARDKERYYWLKLHRDFFKRHDIRIIEDVPNGTEYVLFYLKLMTEAIDHEGALRFSDTIPYSESMLASVTNTNIDVVRSALRLLTELGMVEMQEDGTLFIGEVAKLLDSETYQTRRKREAAEHAALPAGGVYSTPDMVDSTREKETEIETEKETDKEIETESDTDSEKQSENFTAPEGAVCRTKDVRRIVEAWNSLGLQQVVRITGRSRRGCMLRSRVKEHGVEGVLEAIEKIRHSAFLTGQNGKGWVITFEWFVKPNNFVKVLEGNYDNAYRRDGERRTGNGFLEMLMEEGGESI